MRIPFMLASALLVYAAPAAAQETDYEWVVYRYELSVLDDDAEPSPLAESSEAWHFASAEAGLRRARLSGIARVNWASRFGRDGYQLEGDLYPVWPGVGYAYVSGAWSEGGPFPALRLAGELFASLPSAFEASAGAVYMDFESDDVTILVGSLAKYAGNYWIAARPSWATDEGSLALTLIARRYLTSADEFVTLRLIGGTTPELIATRGSTSLESLGAQVDAQLELTPRVHVLPLAALVREELRGGGEYRLRLSLGVGGMVRF